MDSDINLAVELHSKINNQDNLKENILKYKITEIQIKNQHFISQLENLKTLSIFVKNIDNINSLPILSHNFEEPEDDNSEENSDEYSDEENSDDEDLYDSDLENVKLVLRKDELDKLKILSRDSVENDICSICQHDLFSENNNEFVKLPKCSHIFHAFCIIEHLSKYDHHCPNCRISVGRYKPLEI